VEEKRFVDSSRKICLGGGGNTGTRFVWEISIHKKKIPRVVPGSVKKVVGKEGGVCKKGRKKKPTSRIKNEKEKEE